MSSYKILLFLQLILIQIIFCQRSFHGQTIDMDFMLIANEQEGKNSIEDAPKIENIIEMPKYKGHGDLFKCHPCNCSHTNKGKVIAYCISRNLQELPDTLPPDIWLIKMSLNPMFTFNVSSILIYPNLTTLDLTNNKIKTVTGQMTRNATSQLRHLILNSNHIHDITNDALCVVPNLQSLNIADNKMVHIKNTTFKCLHKLLLLDLSINNIKRIDAEAFDSLNMLHHLFLRSNKYLVYGSKRFGPRIVQNLKRLRTLDIQRNSRRSSSYPNELLGELTNLEELSIDGLGDAEFGPQLIKLTKLKKLNFGPHANCYFRYIPSTFFQNTPFLISLMFHRCSFSGIDPRAFQYIPRLEEYTLKYHTTNYYHLNRAFQDLELINTQNSSLTALTFIHVHHSRIQCRILSADQGKYIKNMKLKSLDLGDNRLVLLQDDFLHNLPKSLERLYLRKNKFTLSANLWGRMSFLTNLQEIDISIQNIDAWQHKEGYGSGLVLRQQTEEEAVDNSDVHYVHRQNSPEQFYAPDKSTYSFSSEYDVPNSGPQLCEESKYAHSIENVSMSEQGDISFPQVRLPPKLSRVIATRYLFFGSVILFHFMQANNLTHLNLSYTFQVDWGYGRLTRKVKVLDMSHNQCLELLPTFFPNGSDLRHLSIQYNLLGASFARDVNGTIMSQLDKLLYLDISGNIIFKLPYYFLRGLKNLKTLVMNENKLQLLNVHLSHMKSLNFIDASKSSISWISKKTRDDLDELATASNSNIVIDLTDNPLPCTCAGLEILQWMDHSKVFFINHAFLKCRFSNGTSGSLADVPSMIRLLMNDCKSYRGEVIAIVSGLSGLVVTFLFYAFLYRKRWRILYAINNGFLVKMFGFKPNRTSNNTAFKFDAYIVYSEEDRDFVLKQLLEEIEKRRGHKVCVEDRDFLPGTYNFSNINSAVQNSSVTLLVVSENFLEANEFNYVILSGLLEEYYSTDKREVCYLLLYDQVSTSSLPKDLQMLMLQNRFIAYPPTDEGEMKADVYQGFWDRLSLVIGRTNYTDSSPLLASPSPPN